jgi:hypothetical protein
MLVTSLAFVIIVLHGLYGLYEIYAESQEISKFTGSLKCYLLLQKRNPLKHRGNYSTMAKEQNIYSGVIFFFPLRFNSISTKE